MEKFLFVFICLSQMTIFGQTVIYNPVPDSIAPFPTSSYSDVEFSDVDGDGDLDALVAGYAFPDYITNIYKNNGSGNFTSLPVSPFIKVQFSAIAFADIDGDGDEDVAIAGLTQNTSASTRVYRNDGLGNFSFIQVNINIEGVYGGDIAFADVDGDGDQDLAIAGFDDFNNEIYKIYRNNGVGHFTLHVPQFQNIVSSGQSIDFADVDNDNDQDLLISGRANTNIHVTRIYKNDGFGNFTQYQSAALPGVSTPEVGFFDADNDGDQDVFVTGTNSLGSRISDLYLNNGIGGYTIAPGHQFTGIKNGTIDFADVNADDKIDIILAGWSSNGPDICKLYLNQGNASFIEDPGNIFQGFDSGSIAFADVDNDADQDLLLIGNVWNKLYLNNGCYAYTDVIVTDPILTSVAIPSYANFQWLDCDNNFQPIPGATAQSFHPNVNGNYAVQVTGNGCSNISACFNISTISTASNDFISFDKSIQVYPNPVTDLLAIDLTSTSGEVVIRIYEISGKLILSRKVSHSGIYFEKADWQPGMYSVEIIDGKNSKSFKIIKPI